MNSHSLRIQAVRFSFVILFLLSALAPLSLADDSSQQVESDDEFFQFVVTVDDLVQRKEDDDAIARVREMIKNEPLKESLLARIEVMKVNRDLHTLIGVQRSRKAVGLHAAHDLLISQKTRQSLQSSVNVLQQFKLKDTDDFRLCFVVASTALEHAAVFIRHSKRMQNVSEPKKHNSQIELFAAELLVPEISKLGEVATLRMMRLNIHRPETSIYSGILLHLAGKTKEGAELIFKGVEMSSQFAFPVQYLINNLDSNGIGSKPEHYPVLVGCLHQQEEVADRILASARELYLDEYTDAMDRVTFHEAYEAGGISLAALQEGVVRAKRMMTLCDLLEGMVKTLRTTPETSTTNAGDGEK